MNCSMFCILTFWEVVPQSRIPSRGCVTAASTNTSLPKGLGEDVADVERFPSLAERMKDRSPLLPSTLKDKTAACPSCLRTGYSSAVSVAGNGCAETAGCSSCWRVSFGNQGQFVYFPLPQLTARHLQASRQPEAPLLSLPSPFSSVSVPRRTY